jgi:YidC/Oxa1 family membrane protein insertase
MPLELIIETAYTFFFVTVRGNYGFALVGVSVFVSFLCLPLYAQAESLQEKERAIQRKMQKRRESIRTHFKGDERYLILSMYYRENHYHPLMALRGSMSLLIQIPFFIAAYSFLSHLEVLKGASFFVIPDLGAPDGLLRLGSFSINILPVIMTLINIVSGAIYARGFPFRERAQLYIMALIFFVLLYASPAALVIYWTCNNIFSLIKNILYKLKNPKKILPVGVIIAFVCLAAACIYIVSFRPHSKEITKTIAITVSILAAGIPLYAAGIRFAGKRFFSHLKNQQKDIRVLFFLSCAAAWLLCGIVIPFNVAASDPSEFSFLAENPSPFGVLIPAVLAVSGLLVFWPGYIFLISSRKVRIFFSFGMAALVILGIINAFGFPGSYGMLSKTLTFPLGVNFYGTSPFWVSNIFVCVAILFGCALVYRSGKIKILSALMTILIMGGCAAALWKAVDIQQGYSAHREVVLSNETYARADKKPQPVVQLSESGKNVFIIMIDRAVSAFFPLILEEREELKSAFSGFVYYPNTVSFFGSTIFGAPPIFGGYEYTPEKFHERKDKPMVDKHNEALLLLPTLFQQQGYTVSAFDLPYVNYQNMPDISFFTSRGINSENLMGKYDRIFIEELGEDAPVEIKPDLVLRRNFVMFSLFAIAPPALRTAVYRDGSYWNAVGNDRQDIVLALSSYSELHYLPQLTSITKEGNTLTLLVNNLTHSAAWLQYPDYTVKARVTDLGPDRFYGDSFAFQDYHVHVAACLLLAKWFDVLREQGVYDNTRIIIVADHDQAGIFKPFITEEMNQIIADHNPILLVKDFYAKGEVKTDMSFMTNADVPLLATQGLISSPVNPFTGKELKPDKDNGVNILLNGFTQPHNFPDYRVLRGDSEFHHVKDNIFEKKNWTKFTWQGD